MHQTRTLIPIKKIFRSLQARTFIISLVCPWIWFAKTEDQRVASTAINNHDIEFQTPIILNMVFGTR